jgi:exonuclease III
MLQEVRLKAMHKDQRGKPLASEWQEIKESFETVFSQYHHAGNAAIWSLADTKYAGTLTLIHKRIRMEDFEILAYTPQSATTALLKQHGLTRQQVGLAEEVCRTWDPKSSPVVKTTKQTSVMNFFAAKKPSATKQPAATTTCNGLSHHPDGRFQYLRFANLDLIQTYVPNNGVKDESFQRRQDWDAAMLDLFQSRQATNKYLKENSNKSSKARPLLWCGDMNCAFTYQDGTHWSPKQEQDGSIYEWWTDEAKCFVGGNKKENINAKHAENVGMPSFTPAERRRFGELMTKSDFSDVWRSLHPNGVVTDDDDDSKTYASEWDKPNYTWRGHLGKNGGFGAKYQGKGQRLDYFLLSPSILVSSVEACDILGYGEQREGLFCGSDHCASLLKLKKDF